MADAEPALALLDEDRHDVALEGLVGMQADTRRPALSIDQRDVGRLCFTSAPG